MIKRIKLKLWYAIMYPQDITAVLWCVYKQYRIKDWEWVYVYPVDLSHGHVCKLDAYVQKRIKLLQAGNTLTSVKPIMITKDNVVIDGNGRVAAYKYVSPLTPIKVKKEV